MPSMDMAADMEITEVVMELEGIIEDITVGVEGIMEDITVDVEGIMEDTEEVVPMVAVFPQIIMECNAEGAALTLVSP